MALIPFSLVLVSAFSHAYWNFLAKGAGDKDVFIGLSKIIESLLFCIPFLWVLKIEGFDQQYWYFVLVAACFVFLNYFFISQAYKRVDLSIAYPVSRSSTLFLPLVAYLFLGETINPTGWISLSLILLGVFLMFLDDLRAQRRELAKNGGILFALMAAATVACYTVWDKMAVRHIHPFIYFYSYTLITSLFYGVLLGTKFNLPQLRHEWAHKKKAIAGVAVLNTFTYLLVLVALSLSKAIFVGALRQISLVVGVFLGWKLYHEPVSKTRLLGVVGIILGSLLTLAAK